MDEREGVIKLELTKEEAVRLHRELWDWLSKNPDRFKSDWPGWDNGEYVEVERKQYCFACALSTECESCIIEWPGENCCDREHDDCEGLYQEWEDSNNKKKRSKLAEQIRDLPVREEKLDDQ